MSQPNESFFVTGALGCLGAWVVANLVQDGVKTTIYDLGDNLARLHLIMNPDDVKRVNIVKGDITDGAAVTKAAQEAATTHLIHLAALQVPFCIANPPVGAAVNVVGTVNAFETVKALGLKQLVYASSVAVYGSKEEYANALIQHDDLAHPHNHYGVFKQANEGTARIYWQDDGIASIGLRPYTIYGPARDQGLTSSPTKAMLAAARGEGYHIPFGGYNGFQYVDDIAKIFIQAARAKIEGADVFNIQGSVSHVRDVIAGIEKAVPEMTGRFTFDDNPLSLPDGQDGEALSQRLGNVPNTSLDDGIAATIAHFRKAIAAGLLPATSDDAD